MADSQEERSAWTVEARTIRVCAAQGTGSKEMEKRYVSALLSGLIMPGAGQFYNRQRLKGIVYIVLTLLSIVALVFLVMRGLYRALEYTMATGGRLWDVLGGELGASRTSIVVWVLILAVSWAASIVDAYLAARKQETREVKRFISRKG